MIDQQSKSAKVTLEDLLRLKRAERPKADFWADFDRNLHAKQLAAIVEKRPWWRRQSWVTASRWSLPLSAAAALTVTFATVGHPVLAGLRHRSAAPATESSRPVAATIASVNAPAIELPAVPAISIAPIERKASPVFVAVSAPAQTPAVAKPAAASSLSVTEQIAGLAVSADAEQTASHFATVSAKDGLAVPELGAFFDKAVSRLDLVSAHSDKTNVVEPLSQVQTPREARRARLVALLSLPGFAEQTDGASNAMRSRERVATHFNDQALYDAISRLDVKGRRSSIQF